MDEKEIIFKTAISYDYYGTRLFGRFNGATGGGIGWACGFMGSNRTLLSLRFALYMQFIIVSSGPSWLCIVCVRVYLSRATAYALGSAAAR